MKKLVLKIQYGGLGDHLLWSPIPRLAKEKHGYDEVFISNYSDYRNPNTKRLVWEYNPYIDGFVDEDAATPAFKTVEQGKNILDALTAFVGLPDDGVRFRDPEIYYIPKYLPQYADVVLYDPNYITNVTHPTSEKVQAYFAAEKITVDFQMKRVFSNSGIDGVPELSVERLEDFCDVIFSCKIFYCLTSGPATLASALKRGTIVLYSIVNPMFHHSKNNIYVKL